MSMERFVIKCNCGSENIILSDQYETYDDGDGYFDTLHYYVLKCLDCGNEEGMDHE